MSSKQSKNSRTLDMYARLCEGKVINKLEESQRFGVDERSIQRDIDDIRAFLDNRLTEYKTIEYDRTKKGFVMTSSEGSDMTNSEILAVTKILLESRAFTKKELNEILNKMVACYYEFDMCYLLECLKFEKYYLYLYSYLLSLNASLYMMEHFLVSPLLICLYKNAALSFLNLVK